METGQFYCIGCQELKDAVFGHRVFRTGYFRLVYPLGYCLVCHSREQASRSAADEGGSGTVFASPDPDAISGDLEPPAVRQAAV
ncbi:MAG: hypothetical protein A9Z00_11260 [Thermobacillus sp. ZCTH02-B1]|uniref:hypothetical protein n=1 Tax=Thermobacillus sp. ZCTH02-B1 TaxID=1858795 RepID=UPI000B575845|nr:hypothetical protein [Thermobacillus sp. ZCTH02-B1]OUM95729.1 MAG: hypothetical protein A9Z00_11260 [Thermobacillus sp. ZCTH02-B1]